MKKSPWSCIATLGDANPLDFGGAFVMRSADPRETPQLWILEEPCDDAEPPLKWVMYRFDLDRCTYTAGVLSANPFRPNQPAWFGEPDALTAICAACDWDRFDLISALCSDDIHERARAYYHGLVAYYGAHEFDPYPTAFSMREIRPKIDAWLRQAAKANAKVKAA